MNYFNFIIIASFFFAGISLGSFFNVFFLRFVYGYSGKEMFSFCIYCKRYLKWYDKIPLISFLILCGKCRFCNKRIKFQYFFIEILFSIFCYVLYYFYGLTLETIEYISMFSLLFLISMIDFKTYYIPIDLLLSFIIMGFFFGIINNNENIFLLKHEDFTIRLLFEIDIFSRFFGLIVSFFVLFGLIFFFTSFFRKFKLIKKTNFVMGLADPLFFAGIISFFGLNKIPIILFLSSAQGFIYFILCNLWNKFFSKKKCFIKLGYNIIPLAPFLSIASLELILFF